MKWMSSRSNLGDEVWQGVEARLNLAPVIICRPIAHELLHGRELDALRAIGDLLAFRPLCRLDAPAEIHENLLSYIDAEGTDIIFSSHMGISSFGRLA
jgi:hypothetical protein